MYPSPLLKAENIVSLQGKTERSAPAKKPQNRIPFLFYFIMHYPADKVNGKPKISLAITRNTCYIDSGTKLPQGGPTL
jgi:hypothetical protein